MKRLLLAVFLVILLSQSSFAALKINGPAPDFRLRDRQNSEFSLRGLEGEKNKENGSGTVLSFFASWCVPCRHELPILNSLVDELKKKGVKVVIIGVREDFAKIGSLLAELKVDKPLVLSDQDGKVAGLYQVRFLPTTFFVDPDGTVKDIIFGEIRDESELRESIEKLLK